MHATHTIPLEELSAQVIRIFIKAGFSALQAQSLARVIVAGERDGCKSHGVYRIEGCLRTLRAGKVNPVAVPALHTDTSAVVRVDAQGGFANAAFDAGLDAMEALAERFGLAAMVITDCTHFSALWPEVEALAARGLAGLAMCPSYATVAPHGGMAALLGTNPIAFGWPRPGQHPYVFDFATSVAARGEVELHRIAGKPLPEGWAIDAQGQPTTNPEAALAGAMLPFGGHKGSAIATMVELLAAAMIGDLTSPEALEYLGTTTLAPRHGELILAFNPRRFAEGREGDPFTRAEILLQAITAQGARLPSQRRYAARDVSESIGVTLSAQEQAQLARLEALGLDGIA
jgi:delta1-piperideine-2-carboxylate reductase